MKAMYLLLAFVVLVGAYKLAWGEATHQASSEDGIRIVLFNDPCTLDAVSNLKQKATWTEKGRTYTGCWGSMGPMVVAYFEDRTVVALPSQVFTRVTSI